MRLLTTRRAVLGASLAAPFVARAAPVLRVGDQRGGFKSVMEAAGVMDGAPIAWNLFAAASPLLEALNADAIDVGGAGDAPFAFARAAGSTIKAFAATRSPGTNVAIVVPKDAPVHDFADLRGKRIGTSKGSVGHYLVVAARDRAKLRPSDISIAFLSPADAGAAFASGSIDAWATWSQYIFLAVAHNDARVLMDGRGLMSGLSYETATASALAGKRDLIVDFKARLERALRWGLANPDAYAAAWSRETGVPLDISKLTLTARGFTPAPIDKAMIADQQHVVDLYVRERVLPQGQDVGAGFDVSFG